jgi:amino acid transporter
MWYPTIFSFIASTFGSLISPTLSQNQYFILAGSLICFWAVTWVSSKGIRATSIMSLVCSFFGTLLPMLSIIVLAAVWLLKGNESATPLSWSALIPTAGTVNDLAYFTNILYSVVGIEVVAIHASDAEEPDRSYPKALTVSGLFIFITLTLSSLALCIIIPTSQLSLISGIMDAFSTFLDTYNAGWVIYLLGLSIIIGALGITSSWTIGIARALNTACKDAGLPSFLQKKNKNKMPYVILNG